MLQQLFLSLGVGTGALLLSLTLNWRRQTVLKADDFWHAFVIVGTVAMLAVLPLLRLSPDAGDVMRGNGPSKARIRFFALKGSIKRDKDIGSKGSHFSGKKKREIEVKT